MKKLLALLLTTAMTITCLAGCGSKGTTDNTADTAVEESADDSADDSAADTDAEEATEVSDAAAQAIADRKAAAEESGEYEKVVVSFFDWTGAPAGIDRINEELSKHTRETLGLDVELLIIDSAAYSEDIKLMLSSGEQVDLFSTCGPGYMTCVNTEYTMDLEEDGLLDKVLD